MAKLLAQWEHARPATLRGVCWYRLPVPGDNLNWSWKTLQTVMERRAPIHQLRIVASASQPRDIVAINTGETDESLPKIVCARWRQGVLVAADALEGYTLRQSGNKNIVTFDLNRSGEILRLPPDNQRKIGWIRCEPATAIDISFAGDPGDSADMAARIAGDGH
jgi:hypothetical protein